MTEPRCKTCALTRYEHVDHDHRWLTVHNGRCPFGDCGYYEPEEG